MSGDVLSLAAEITPYVSAAAAAYGGAVLVKARDEAADATVGLGRRLLQRVFGCRRDGEQLPGALADLAASPRDEDALAAVRLAIRKAVADDPVLEADLRSMLASAPGVVMHVHAGRDALSSGRDQVITIHNYAEGAARPQEPGLPGWQIWGNVPARNPGFKGREALLAGVREALLAGDRAVVRALHGMGGVGKTQLASEYAHRFARSYELVWWIASEQPGLIGHQFTALADALGSPGPGADLEVTRRAVMGRLHEMQRWLLVFDNAESPRDLAGWLPGGTGHVLITSRASEWAELAVPVEVGVLDRAESVAILQDRLPALADGDADRIAGAVGDLALAVAQAAGYMTDGGMSAREYLALLRSRTAEVMREGHPVTYPRPLAAVTQLALEQLRAEHPVAAEVAVLRAFLAPDPVPAEWFPRAGAALPAPLARKAADPVAWHQVLAAAWRSGLVRLGNGELQMHRLTQAVIRSQLSAQRAASARSRAEEILTASHSSHVNRRVAQDPATWPEWARLLPHLLALDPASSGNPQLRRLARNAVWYLVKRGDARAGRDLAQHLDEQWHQVLGPDHPDTLDARYLLAFALSGMGFYQEARDLDEDTLARCRRVLGENHPATLFTANNLALQLSELGNKQAARELLADVLSRLRQAHADDLHAINGAANNLAQTLFDLGETDTARQLYEVALTGFRRVLGDDHPDTIECAMSFAIDMRELGQAGAARRLHEDALARSRRVLGDDHPQTLRCVEELAADLRAAGDTHIARELDEHALAGYRKIYGDDHPRTLKIARRLHDEKTAPGTAETG
jgi:tetratricopeptide (TPR) repeat protein